MPSHLQTTAVQDLLFRHCYTKLCSEILLEIRVSEQDFPLLEVEKHKEFITSVALIHS